MAAGMLRPHVHVPDNRKKKGGDGRDSFLSSPTQRLPLTFRWPSLSYKGVWEMSVLVRHLTTTKYTVGTQRIENG